MSATHILAIDQGTTSSRAIVYDAQLNTLASAQQEFAQIFPASGWVEHDADVIWDSVVAVCREALKRAKISASEVAAIGITNQRETTVVWDRASGKPIANAIVWQDRRTAKICRELSAAGHADVVESQTGLRLDPYFSATKVAWMLDNVEGARAKAERGELAFGTIDSFLLWRLTGGKVHATDATNASRTALFDIHRQCWSDELCALFRVPASVLPEVRDCASEFGEAQAALFGGPIAVRGIAGDQQSALIGQSCFEKGMTKSTYGTGCFVIANTGSEVVSSTHQMLSTVAYRLNGETTYGLEGSIFVAGSAIQWLRDGLGLVKHAGDTEGLAQANGVERDVFMVPAFTGLGAPYWDPDARGALFGLTRGSDKGAIVTATLQAIAYQTYDLIKAMADDGVAPGTVRVDGGMVSNNWFLQFLADITGRTIERPSNIESTAVGAASLAALQAGLIDDMRSLSEGAVMERAFTPAMPSALVDELLLGWHEAVRRTRSSAEFTNEENT